MKTLLLPEADGILLVFNGKEKKTDEEERGGGGGGGWGVVR